MSQLLNASIDVTLLLEMINKGHSAANRGKQNGKVYVNVGIWVNDEPDRFGDHVSIQLQSHKDGKERDKKINPPKKDGSPSDKCYIGRGKKADFGNTQLQPGENTGLALNPNIYGGQPTQQAPPQQGQGFYNPPASNQQRNPWDQQRDDLPF